MEIYADSHSLWIMHKTYTGASQEGSQHREGEVDISSHLLPIRYLQLIPVSVEKLVFFNSVLLGAFAMFQCRPHVQEYLVNMK